MEWLTSPEIWAAFLTLTALEIVLGIDNIIFISILVARLPKHQQAKGRFFGLALAMITRILLLLSITWIMRLTFNLFTVAGHGISGRDLILFFGGLFLIVKSIMELFHSIRCDDESHPTTGGSAKFIPIILQIAVIDVVVSRDSGITAVGLVQHIPVMVAAIVISVMVMMMAAGTISAFIERHPSLKILALAFLVAVGVVLVAESLEIHISKGYVYFAMAFSLAVECLNIRMRTTQERKAMEKLNANK